MHPLHTPEFLAALNSFAAIDRCRGTGRSTILSLKAITSAMSLPNTRVYLQDHHGSDHADRHLMEITRTLIERLSFDHFKFGESVTGFWICFGEPPMGGNRKGVKLKD